MKRIFCAGCTWWKKPASSLLYSCWVIMTKWKRFRKALTVDVNVLSDPWAGAPAGGLRRARPRRTISTPWRRWHQGPPANAPASRHRQPWTLARGTTGWKSSGRLAKTMSRWQEYCRKLQRALLVAMHRWLYWINIVISQRCAHLLIRNLGRTRDFLLVWMG